MKYEVILKVKDRHFSTYEQVGKIFVHPEHLQAQLDAYKYRVENKMDVYDYVILVNELTDDGVFVRCIQ